HERSIIEERSRGQGPWRARDARRLLRKSVIPWLLRRPARRPWLASWIPPFRVPVLAVPFEASPSLSRVPRDPSGKTRHLNRSTRGGGPPGRGREAGGSRVWWNGRPVPGGAPGGSPGGSCHASREGGRAGSGRRGDLRLRRCEEGQRHDRGPEHRL